MCLPVRQAFRYHWGPFLLTAPTSWLDCMPKRVRFLVAVEAFHLDVFVGLRRGRAFCEMFIFLPWRNSPL